MTNESFVQLAGKLGAKKDGQAWLMPGDADVSLLVALEGETLAIAKVTRIDVDGNAMVAQTARGESYGFIVDDLRALKADRSETVKRERGAGFHQK